MCVICLEIDKGRITTNREFRQVFKEVSIYSPTPITDLISYEHWREMIERVGDIESNLQPHEVGDLVQPKISFQDDANVPQVIKVLHSNKDCITFDGLDGNRISARHRHFKKIEFSMPSETLKKSCTCGSAFTSNKNHHSSWCDIN